MWFEVEQHGGKMVFVNFDNVAYAEPNGPDVYQLVFVQGAGATFNILATETMMRSMLDARTRKRHT